jgi:hypothetical protein
MAVRDKALPMEELEVLILTRALVDPALTEDDVREWQKASDAGEIELVTRAIAELSGLAVNAPKSDV